MVSANRVQPAPVEPNEPPEFLTDTTLRNVDDTVAGVNIGEPVAATDADSDTLTYSLDADRRGVPSTLSPLPGQLQDQGRPGL